MSNNNISGHCAESGSLTKCTLHLPCDLWDEFQHSCWEKGKTPNLMITAFLVGWLYEDSIDYAAQMEKIRGRMKTILNELKEEQ